MSRPEGKKGRRTAANDGLREAAKGDESLLRLTRPFFPDPRRPTVRYKRAFFHLVPRWNTSRKLPPTAVISRGSRVTPSR